MIVVAAALMTIGVVMIASTSASLQHSILRVDFWKTTFGRQTLYVVAGFLVMLVCARFGYRLVATQRGSRLLPALLLFLFSLATLAAVLVPGIGVQRNGARRWLQFGPAELGLGFQPSELAKLGLVAFLAVLLGRASERAGQPAGPQPSRRAGIRGCGRPRLRFGTVLLAALAIGLCAGLVGIEDFGTAALIAAVGGFMLFAAGSRVWQLFLLVLPGLAAFAYLLLAKPYRLERLTAFRNIWADPRGDGYHAIQSLTTIASGGWYGRGLGAGVQKYGYLPESRTDFIFSVICEEAGFFGALVVILMFASFVWLGMTCVRSATSPVDRLLVLGVTLVVGLQAAMNIAVVTVAAPTKGIALPLVSAGGSGILFLGAAIGLAASVSSHASGLASCSQQHSRNARWEAVN